MSLQLAANQSKHMFNRSTIFGSPLRRSLSGSFSMQRPYFSGAPHFWDTCGQRDDNPDNALLRELTDQMSHVVAVVGKIDFSKEVRHAEDLLKYKDSEIQTLEEDIEVLRCEVQFLRSIVNESTQRMNNCVNASQVALDVERELRKDIETKATRTIEKLMLENTRLLKTKAALEKTITELQNPPLNNTTSSPGSIIAISAQCLALERENDQLMRLVRAYADELSSLASTKPLDATPAMAVVSFPKPTLDNKENVTEANRTLVFPAHDAEAGIGSPLC